MTFLGPNTLPDRGVLFAGGMASDRDSKCLAEWSASPSATELTAPAAPAVPFVLDELAGESRISNDLAMSAACSEGR